MRIHRLEVEGFGPFRDRQVVDFDAFAHDGIFLISGRTGAGKSSILDAICFALYGGVPRYDDGEKRIRSDHSRLDEPTRVALDFSAAGRRWRVERVPAYERLKRTGTGTTTSAAQASLDEWVDGGWVGRAARPVDVAHELEPILGLTQAQFLQVILLAQGRFARFLLARNDERQALLRTLFDSRRFADYEDEFDRRRKEATDQLAAEAFQLDLRLEEAERLARAGHGDDSAGDEPSDGDEDERDEAPEAGDVVARLARADRSRLRAVRAADEAGAFLVEAVAARSAAEEALALARRQRAQQEQRAAARIRLASLEQRTAEIEALREELRAARAAEALRPAVTAAVEAETDRVAAEAARARAEHAWLGAGQTPSTARELRESAAAFHALLGTLRAAADAEGTLPALTAAEEQLVAAVEEIDAARRLASDRRAELPTALLEIDERIRVLTAEAALLETAQKAGAEAESRAVAARELRDRAEIVSAAEESAAVAGKELTRASARLDELRDRRFRDRAGELAADLEPGEPCRVCGSLDHPSPASRQDDPVSDDDIAAGEQAKARAVEADRSAAERLDAARASQAEAAVRAGGLSLDEATDAVTRAQRAVAVARAACEELERQTLARRSTETELARLESEEAASASRRSETVEALAVARERRTSLQALVEQARAGFASVAERIARTENLAALATALAEADAEVAARRADERKRADERDALLTGSGFASPDAVVQALRAADEQDRLEDAVRTHAVDVEKTKSTLLELELAGLPDEPVRLDEAEAAYAAATATWERAVTAQMGARDDADRIAAAVEFARSAHDGVADLAERVAVIQRLADTVAGRAPNTMRMNLETFVLAAELEEIVAAANIRLDDMSEGRYALRHTDARAVRGAASGLGIDVIDRHTGMPRPVQSLSGGETFLASLALALGLAEVVTARAGGITLDTLFIDEGFGSLDAETLDMAMRTLDELRQGGRTVGVISHVEPMKDVITAQLQVESTPEGPSVIRQDAAIRSMR